MWRESILLDKEERAGGGGDRRRDREGLICTFCFRTSSCCHTVKKIISPLHHDYWGLNLQHLTPCTEPNNHLYCQKNLFLTNILKYSSRCNIEVTFYGQKQSWNTVNQLIGWSPERWMMKQCRSLIITFIPDMRICSQLSYIWLFNMNRTNQSINHDLSKM